MFEGMPTVRRLDSALADPSREVARADLLQVMQELQTKYFNSVSEAESPYEYAKRVCCGGCMTRGEFPDVADLRSEQKSLRAIIHAVSKRLAALGIITEDAADDEVRQRISRLQEVASHLYDILWLSCRTAAAADPSIPGCGKLVGDDQLDETRKLNTTQDLQKFIQDRAFIDGYRKFGANLYSQILTKDNLPTRAWKLAMSIEDFVYREASFDRNNLQWHNMTALRDNAGTVAGWIQKQQLLAVPLLNFNRYGFAFLDGVYDAQSRSFHPHRDDPDPLRTEFAACNYFPVPMGYEAFAAVDAGAADWRTIPTPNLTRILQDQKLPVEVQEWAYALMGRLLYPIGAHDAWEVCPFFKGKAGTGKSTICKVMLHLYGRELMGVLANNIEKKFGLSAFKHKLAYVAPEVKRDFELDQAAWQSMVTGEAMSIPIKNETAEDNFVWTLQGMMAGNELPAWTNNSGSVSRRLVLFEFNHRVRKGDPNLMRKLQSEIGPILVKINAAYLEMTQRYGKSILYDVLPEYFKNTQKRVCAQTHTLAAFLQDSGHTLAFGDGAYMREADFKELLRRYVESNQLPRSKWNTDYYENVFEEWDLAMELNAVHADDAGVDTKGNWVLGVRFRQDGAAAAGGGGAAAAGGGGAAPTIRRAAGGPQAAAVREALTRGALCEAPGKRCTLPEFLSATGLAYVNEVELEEVFKFKFARHGGVPVVTNVAVPAAPASSSSAAAAASSV
jgi:hypothetical protein